MKDLSYVFLHCLVQTPRKTIAGICFSPSKQQKQVQTFEGKILYSCGQKTSGLTLIKGVLQRHRRKCTRGSYTMYVKPTYTSPVVREQSIWTGQSECKLGLSIVQLNLVSHPTQLLETGVYY